MTAATPPAGPASWRADMREKEVFFPVPVTDERLKILGTIFKVDYKPNNFGYRSPDICKITLHVEGDEGRYLLWGTCPGAIIDTIEKAQEKDDQATLRGALVEFFARVEPGGRSPEFGFFKKPTRARVIVAGRGGREA